MASLISNLWVHAEMQHPLPGRICTTPAFQSVEESWYVPLNVPAPPGLDDLGPEHGEELPVVVKGANQNGREIAVVLKGPFLRQAMPDLYKKSGATFIEEATVSCPPPFDVLYTDLEPPNVTSVQMRIVVKWVEALFEVFART